MAKKKNPYLSSKSAKAARDAAVASAVALCKSLAGIAAFRVEDKRAQMKIYAAIKTITVLATLPPMPQQK